MANNISPVIFGIASTKLSDAEKSLFTATNPLGFILFKRNCQNKQQLRQLIAELKDVTNRNKLLILIDQEGGRVSRLQPPTWRNHPAAGKCAALAQHNLQNAKRACYLQSRIIAAELAELGITVNCTPVLDIPTANSHNIIGDRAIGDNAQQVITLAHEIINALFDGGVLPVIKHIPGHGRATVDSHKELPIIDTPLAELEKTDFVPFSTFKHMPMAMTAHIIYTALDPHNVATISAKVLNYIRQHIGFTGLLLSDDISMQALKGPIEKRAADAIKAGCDVILHCNGKIEEMRNIAQILPPISNISLQRAEQAIAQLRPPKPIAINAAETELQSLLNNIS